MWFEMQKLAPFPMEKLCYDLKLEVFEEMTPKATIELVKVNAEFRSTLLRTPWIVFGHYVYNVRFQPPDIWIGPSSWIEREWLKLDTDLHFSMMKRIHSCNELTIRFGLEHFSDTQAMILNQLNSVEYLYLDDYKGKTNATNILKFLENFRLGIGKTAHISLDLDLLIEKQVISSLFKSFIANQMNDCQHLQLCCRSVSAFHFFIDALANTSIKCLISLWSFTHSLFEAIVQSIVEERIPRKNFKAAFRLHNCSQQINARIIDFLSQFPGVKRIDGKNEEEVIQMLGEVWRKHLAPCQMPEIIIFRRKIDSSNDFVYMLTPRVCNTDFFTFHVQSRSEMMEF